jgi:hypothetical protein
MNESIPLPDYDDLEIQQQIMFAFRTKGASKWSSSYSLNSLKSTKVQPDENYIVKQGN